MLSPEAREAVLAEPELFISHYFRHRLDKLEDFHLRLLRTATEETRGLILYPAAHGKTTLVSTLLPIWAICKDPNVRIAVIAKNDSDATGIMMAIQAELVTNDELISDFGPFKPTDEAKPWAREKMSVDGRTLIAKEPTIAVFGSGARTVLGHRTDWTICDDVITEKNSATPEQRYKIREWFNQSVETMPHPVDGRVTVVGTLFDPADLYNDLIDLTDPETGEPLWRVQREDAIVDEDKRQTLWPERWPWKSLMGQKAKMGTLDFNKRFRNIAVDASRLVFREEYIRGGWLQRTQYPGCLDKGLRVGEFDPLWRRVAGFDPAIGVGKHAKFCAHVTLGFGACTKHEHCVWVIDVLRDQMTLPQQVENILVQHEKYELGASVIEINAYQVGLYHELERRMQEDGVAFKIEPHTTSRVNKPDPELGVQAMAPWFENGQVHIPWGDLASQHKMRVLVDELIAYPGRTTDTVMAFWFAWRRLQESAPKYKSFNRLAAKTSAWKALGSPGRKKLKNPYYAKRSLGVGPDNV